MQDITHVNNLAQINPGRDRHRQCIRPVHDTAFSTGTCVTAYGDGSNYKQPWLVSM